MITIVVGGQYGGEGKGKICAYLGAANGYPIVCRTGGVNSSHTVVNHRGEFRLRMIPASAAEAPSKIIFGAGSLLHLPTLFHESDTLGVDRRDLLIDPRAGIITDECVAEQRADPRYESIGSTLTGTGYASAWRCQRRLPLARSFRELRPHFIDVPRYLRDALRNGSHVLVEGHQGSGLSNYHGDYPYTSSRDCIASALLSELGVGLGYPVEVIVVVKLFPTRNHGGKLPREISLEEASALGIEEFGGGSWGIKDRRRRVGKLEYRTVERAIILNNPSCIALTGFDYLFPELRGVCNWRDLSRSALDYIEFLSRRLNVRIGLVSTGADTRSVVDLRDFATPRMAEPAMLIN